jgi:ABC-type nitrate/sulfonate/bicarbonate transport system substrate-binding protein
MRRATLSVLRGICQMPAYVAYEKEFFRDEDLDVTIRVSPTAWMVPDQLAAEEAAFAVIPWTRVATSAERGVPLVAVAGSGYEEAAVVVRNGIETGEVRTVALPAEGGMKDLTALALLEHLGWHDVRRLRQPSGDGAVLALVGEGADAASMIEPYATMLSEIGIGRVVKRTGDVWPGAPGCCLATTCALRDASPDVVLAVVRAFARGMSFVGERPDEAAEIASAYIGVHPRFIRAALRANHPRLDGIRNRDAMEKVLSLMKRLRYLADGPGDFVDTRFIDRITGAR